MIAVRRLLAVTTLAGSAGIFVAPSAFAQAACDTYSGGCGVGGVIVDSSDTDVRGTEFSKVPASARPRTLPFTGGELLLTTAAGLGAVAVGAGFVVGGRRRLQPSL